MNPRCEAFKKAEAESSINWLKSLIFNVQTQFLELITIKDEILIIMQKNNYDFITVFNDLITFYH